MPRWLDLLSYIHALVYHAREREEHADMQARIVQSVLTDPHRLEVTTMGQTIAEMFKEQGGLKARREMLLQAIRVRFGEPTADVIAAVEACSNVAQLEAWFNQVLTARRLADAGIKPQG